MIKATVMNMHASVGLREMVHIVLMIASLHELKIKAASIMNAHVKHL